jgi:DNA-binding NtrC family response regulator
MDGTLALLICDDDDVTRAALRRAFRGHHVTEAATVAEGLAALRVARFDAVLSDFDFGDDVDGLQFLRRVRQGWPATLRVLITGDHDLRQVIGAATGAVDRFILKPWTLESLRSSVELALEERADGAAM